MKTRKNQVREKLLMGKSAYGLMAFEFFTPGLLPILSEAGAEFVVLDMSTEGLPPFITDEEIAQRQAAYDAAQDA